jgi:ubiquinone biosynthesis protein
MSDMAGGTKMFAAHPLPMSGLGFTTAVLVTGIALVIGLAWASSRLLGLPVGTIRALIAGLLGVAAAEAFGRSLHPAQDGHLIVFVTVSLGVPVIVAMIFIVIAEALVPRGSGPGPLEMIRALRRRLTRARRYSQISRIAVRHGLGPYLRGRPLADGDTSGGSRLASSVRQALEDGGVTFVKLGQLLSTRRDLLPAEFIAELSRLQDHVPPARWEQIEPILSESFGAPPGEVFTELSRQPVAAASIAQVYRARLRCDGASSEVAVKVRRPGIEPAVERDLDIVLRLAATLEERTRWARSLGVVALAQGFAAAIREELDFRVEARNTAAVAAAWSADQHSGTHGVPIVVPNVREQYCTRQVLVTEWLSGVNLGAAGPVVEQLGLERAELARSMIRCLLRQIIVDGIFHADPHPGNILLLADGRLALLDLGSVGRLDGQFQFALQNLLLAIGRGDPAALCDALLDLVARPDDIDEQRLERALGQFLALHLAGGAATGNEMFADLFRLVSRFELGVPPEIAAVFRALATLEGTLTQLAPGFDIVTEAREFASIHIAERWTPEAVRKTATDELLALLPVVRRLPRRIERITSALEQGRLSLNVRLFADERDREVVTGLVHLALLTFLGAAIGIIAVLLLGTHGGPTITPTVSLFQVIGYNLIVVSSVLILRVLFRIFTPGR